MEHDPDAGFRRCPECSHAIWPTDGTVSVRHGDGWAEAHADCVLDRDEALDDARDLELVALDEAVGR